MLKKSDNYWISITVTKKKIVISTEAQRNGKIYLVRFLDCIAFRSK